MDANFPAFPATEPNADETPQSLTDEELFEAYLSARVTQALDSLNRAREDLAVQTDDFARVLQVMRRVHELRELRGQVEKQRARVNAARAASGQDQEAATTEEAGSQATPGDAFRTTQSEQADKIIEAMTAQPRTCPSCQALLEPNTAQCHCGNMVHTEAGSAEAATQPSAPWPAS